ncbi:hypothetical protein AOA80_08920 [Methanomassiliicoccales archaeon RumEn M1]|nr:hypothetical protein AOA80_08920 [Methanomassiliicoccales archaeon RumEn M1]
MLASRPIAPEEVYGIYKKRCKIENRFDEAKNCLSADRMHMADDEHILAICSSPSSLCRYGLPSRT